MGRDCLETVAVRGYSRVYTQLTPAPPKLMQGRVLPKNSDLRKLDEPRMQEWAERVRAGGRAMKGAVFNINGDLFPGGAACVGLDPPGPPC